MAMSIAPQVRDELHRRIVAAIAKSFSPCPLIGPKWFRYVGGNNPSYQFTGIGRLAKATCGQPKRVAQILVSNLSLVGLPVAAQVDSNSTIIITSTAAQTLPQAIAKPAPKVQKPAKPMHQPPQKADTVEEAPLAPAPPAKKARSPQKKVSAQTSQDTPAPKARKSPKPRQKKSPE